MIEMNGHRIRTVINKDMKKLVREPATLFLIIMFPIVLTLALGLSFGAIGGGDTNTYTIGIVDMNADGPGEHWSHDLIDNLDTMDILEVTIYKNNESAQDDLSVGDLHGVLVIPSDFGVSCDSFLASPGDPSQWVNTTVALSVDKASMVATQVLSPIVQQAVLETLLGEEALAMTLPVGVGSPALVEADDESVFDFMAPGIFAFGAIFIILTTAQSLTTERQEGLLSRFRTTPLTSPEFIVSSSVSNMIMAMIQVGVIFLMAFAVGYSPDTGAAGIAMAFIGVSIFALTCVGFGLIAASIAKTPEAATGIAFMFIMPMMFLGTFVSATMASDTGAAIGRLVPSYYVTDMLTHLFLRGADVTSYAVMADLAVIIVTAVVVLILGVFIFKRYGNR